MLNPSVFFLTRTRLSGALHARLSLFCALCALLLCGPADALVPDSASVADSASAADSAGVDSAADAADFPDAASVADASDSPDPGSPVVISATRLPTPAAEIASSVTVITAEEIAARQERTLPDILKDVPGLNVVQTGGPGGTASVFIRGSNPNHTKFLIDGIDVSDPGSSAGTFDFAHLLTDDIERVEVLRGPQSGLYGSDAIGGVINIITRNGSGPAQLRASAEGGTFDTFNQTAGLRGSADRFHYSTNVEHLHSGATPVTPLELLQPGERRNDDYYDNLSAGTKLGYDVLPQFDVGLVARYTNTHLRETGDDFATFPSFPAASQTHSNTTEYYTRVSGHLTLLDGAFEQTLGVAYTRKRSSILEPDFPYSLATGKRVKADWQGVVRFAPTQVVVVGVEHARDQISAPISAGNSIDSGYAELQSQIAGSLYSAINARYDSNDRFGGKATYRLAPAYRIAATGTKLKASVGSGFKAPTLSELFQDFPPFFFANPNLRPETSTGYDAGVEQSLGGETVQLGATYFYNRIRNLITSDETGTTYANVGRSHINGVESFIAYSPGTAFTLRADYTYTHAIDDGTDLELLRRPKNKVTVNGTWQATRALAVSATVLNVSSWVDGNRDFSIPRLTAAGYTVVNLASSFEINSHFTVFGRIDNLFDRRYQDPEGFLRPSLGAFAGVRAAL